MNRLRSGCLEYWWILLPLLVIGALYLNTHLYYRLEYGYDFGWHLANSVSVYETGAMPPPPATQFTFEAYQAPLMYVLTAWLYRIFDLVGIDHADGFNRFVPVILCLVSLGWAAIIAVFMQKALRHSSPILRALAVIVVLLLPVVVEINAMYNNDLPVNVLATLALLILWLLLRSRRTLDRRQWLRAAAIIGLAIFFKNNGMTLIPVYLGLAGYAALVERMADSPQARRRARRLLLAAATGLPLMLIPAAIEIWHTSRYTGGDPTGMPLLMPAQSMWGHTPLTFFTTFDTSIFQTPFAVGRLADSPGKNSFWSIQYATLHSDYLNHWNSPAYDSWPRSALIDLQRRYPLPIAQFDSAVLLSFLAIPITLAVLFGLGVSLYRVVRRPRFALHDGSILIVLATFCAEAAQIRYYADHADLGQVPIHARFLAFIFVILFVVGLRGIDKLVRRASPPIRAGATVFLAASFVAYAAISFLMMWLPPI